MAQNRTEERQDPFFMAEAVRLARRALAAEEVPVGAVVVVAGKIVGRGFNQTVGKSDPTAHAEIQALRQAARRVGNYRLTSATVYCTLEPCAMCAGALIWARVSRLVYGVRDPKAGAVDSHLGLARTEFLNHRFKVDSAILDDECRALLKAFFRARRHKKNDG